MRGRCGRTSPQDFVIPTMRVGFLALVSVVIQMSVLRLVRDVVFTRCLRRL